MFRQLGFFAFLFVLSSCAPAKFGSAKLAVTIESENSAKLRSGSGRGLSTTANQAQTPPQSSGSVVVAWPEVKLNKDFCYALHVTATTLGEYWKPQGKGTCKNSSGPDGYGKLFGVYSYGDDATLTLPVGITARIDLIAVPKNPVTFSSYPKPALDAATGTAVPSPQEDPPSVLTNCEGTLSFDFSGKPLLNGQPLKRDAILMASGTAAINPQTKDFYIKRTLNADGTLGALYGCDDTKIENYTPFEKDTNGNPRIIVSGRCTPGYPVTITPTEPIFPLGNVTCNAPGVFGVVLVETAAANGLAKVFVSQTTGQGKTDDQFDPSSQGGSSASSDLQLAANQFDRAWIGSFVEAPVSDDLYNSSLSSFNADRKEYTLAKLPDGRFAYIGGTTVGDAYLSNMILYNPGQSQPWEIASTPGPLGTNPQVVNVDNKAFILGGMLSSNSIASPASYQAGTFSWPLVWAPVAGFSTAILPGNDLWLFGGIDVIHPNDLQTPQQFVSPGFQRAVQSFTPTETVQHACSVQIQNSLFVAGGSKSNGLNPSDAQNTASLRIEVANPPRYKKVSVGVDHTCAIDADDNAFCWGDNSNSQSFFDGFGAGSGTDTSKPTQLPGKYYDISAGYLATCAVRADGVLQCWGYQDNYNNILGNGTSVAESEPQTIGTDYRKVYMANNYACAIDFNGAASCWGANGSGQLGVADDVPQHPIPQAVDGSHTFVSLSLGLATACGIDDQQHVYCWGENGDHQVNSTGANSNSPMIVMNGGSPIVATKVAVADVKTCARTSDGNAYCWGNLTNLGAYVNPSLPTYIGGFATNQVTDLGLNNFSLCVNLVGGAFKCVGQADHLGIGSTATIVQTGMPPVGDIGAIEMKYGATCVLANFAGDGQPYCWGEVNPAQLALGEIAYQSSVSTPVPIASVAYSFMSFHNTNYQPLDPNCVKLSESKILVFGGHDLSGQPTPGAELCTITPANSQPLDCNETFNSRTFGSVQSSVNLLQDGSILITGGRANTASNAPLLDSAEIYDSSLNKFVSMTSLPGGRYGFQGLPLSGGRLFFVGGTNPKPLLWRRHDSVFVSAAVDPSVAANYEIISDDPNNVYVGPYDTTNQGYPVDFAQPGTFRVRIREIGNPAHFNSVDLTIRKPPPQT